MSKFRKKSGHKQRPLRALQARIMRKMNKDSKSKRNQTEKRPKDKNEQIQKIRKKRLFVRRLIKFSIGLFVGILALFLVGITTLTIVLDKEKTTALIKDLIEAQTGGKLDLSWKKYSFASGFHISQFDLYLPKSATPFSDGGEIYRQAIIRVDDIRLDYDLSSWFLLKLIIKNAVIESPRIEIDFYKNHSSLSGLMAYRNQKFGIKDNEEQVETESSLALPDGYQSLFQTYTLLLLWRRLMLVSKNLQVIGNLENGDETKRISVNGINLLNFLKVSGFKNQLTTKIFSDAGVKLKGLEYGDIIINPTIDFKIEDIKLFELNLKAGLDVKSQTTFPKINVDGVFRGGFNSDYSSFNAEIFELTADNILSFSGSGAIGWNLANIKKLNLDLSNNFNYFLSGESANLIYQLAAIKTKGSFNQNCSLQGDLDLSTTNIKLPLVDCATNISELSFRYKDMLVISNIDGEARVMVRNGQRDNEYIAEPEFDFRLESAMFKNSKVTGTIKSLSTSLTSKISISESFQSPRFYLDLNVNKFIVSNNNNSEVLSEPVEIDLHMKTNDTLRKITLKSSAQLGDIMNNSFKLQCVYPCNKIKIDGETTLKKLNKINYAARSLVGDTLKTKLPKNLEGQFKASYQISADLPEEFKKQPYQLLLDVNPAINFDIETSIYDVALLEPNVELDNLIVKTSIDLVKNELKLKNRLNIDEIKIREKTNEIALNSFLNELSTNFEIPKDFNPGELKTSTNTSTNIESASFTKDDLALLFKKIMKKVSIETDGIKKLNIKDADIAIDNFLKTNFNLTLNHKGPLPEFDLNMKTRMNYDFLGSFIEAKSYGSSTTKLTASLTDSEKVSINISQTFNDLSLNLPTLIPGYPIDLEGLNGDFPILLETEISKITEQIKMFKSETSKGYGETIIKSLEVRESEIRSSSDTERKLSNSGGLMTEKFSPIQIKKIKLGGFEVSKILINSSIESNGIFIDEAEFLTMGGVGSANLFISLSPLPTRVVGNFHLANVNTEQIPYRIKNKIIPDEIDISPFTMTSNIDYFITDKVLNGDINISQIGQEQARYFLDLLDPKKLDPNINMARMGLNLGYPKGIKIPIRNGSMDVRLDVRSLGVPLPIPDVIGFPVVGLIENVKNEKGL